MTACRCAFAILIIAIAVSNVHHITSPTGLLLPAKELCALIRKHGALSHVDGAHAIGQIPLNMHDLGCDFYVTSPHKWLMAPKGTGTLFICEELLDRLWVTIASGEWNNKKQKAYRFSNTGTSNLSVMVGLKAAVDFVHTIGPDCIYKRIHELAGKVCDGIKEFPALRLTNASGDSFFAGLVSFEAVHGDLKGVMTALNAQPIRVAGGPGGIRVATDIFTQPAEIQALFESIERGLKT